MQWREWADGKLRSWRPAIRSIPGGALSIALVSVVAAAACAAQDGIGGETQRPVGDLEPCTVTRVVDGDTIHCEPVGRIRLIGIDAPERGQEPFGAMATEALADLLPEGTAVSLERDVEDRDQYGRALRYVWTGDVMANREMIRTGFAMLLTYPPNVQHVEGFTAAQEQARREEAGLWAVEGFACPPRAFRRGDCG